MTDCESKRNSRQHLVALPLFMLVTVAFLSACQTLSVPSSVTDGKKVYSARCVACHGATGRGDGYILFDPPVADLTSRNVREKLDERLFKSIHEGKSNTAMGSWRLILSDEEVWNVIKYVRQLGTEMVPLSRS